MDIDPYRLRLGTRVIGVLDSFIGLGVFIYQLYQMWDYYLNRVKAGPTITGVSVASVSLMTGNLSSDHEEAPNPFTEDENRKLPFYTFIVICLVTFGVNLGQAFMGFTLQVATFGRDLMASLRIITVWTKLSLFLLFILTLKCVILLTGFLTKTFTADWVNFGITIFEISFRIVAIVWVAKFFAFLSWQAEFDCSTCTRPAGPVPRRR